MGQKIHAPLVRPSCITSTHAKICNFLHGNLFPHSPKQNSTTNNKKKNPTNSPSPKPCYLSGFRHCLQHPFLLRTAGLLNQRLQLQCGWLWVGILLTVMQSFFASIRTHKYLFKWQGRKMACWSARHWQLKQRQAHGCTPGECLSQEASFISPALDEVNMPKGLQLPSALLQ